MQKWQCWRAKHVLWCVSCIFSKSCHQIFQNLKTVAHYIISTVCEMSPCLLYDNPKPNQRPHYPNFQFGQYEKKVANATLEYIAWLLVRYYQRHITVAPVSGLQILSAFNSLMLWSTDSEHQSYFLHIRPIVNAQAFNERLVTVLEMLYKLNLAVCPSDRDWILVTLNINLYKKL